MIDPQGSEIHQGERTGGREAARLRLAEVAENDLLARLRKRPQSARLQHRLAAVRMLAGRLDAALEGLVAAHARCPESVEIEFLIAYARREGQGIRPRGDGARLRRLAVPVQPTRFRLYMRAWSFLQARRYGEAIAQLEPPRAPAGSTVWRHVALRHFLTAGGDVQRAEDHLNRAGKAHRLFGPRLRSVPLDEAFFWNPLLAVGADSLARCACRRQLWLLARNAWVEAFRLDPRPAWLEMKLALIPVDGSEEERMLVHLARAVEASPKSGRARFALGVEYARQGFLRRASRELATAWKVGGARGWLAGIGSPRALQHRWTNEAVAAFGRAVEGRREASFLRDGYVRALLGIGRFEEALRQLEIVEKVEANRADFYLRRGGALLGLGRLQEGVNSLDRAISLGGSRRIAREVLEVFGRVGVWTATPRRVEEA